MRVIIVIMVIVLLTPNRTLESLRLNLAQQADDVVRTCEHHPETCGSFAKNTQALASRVYSIGGYVIGGARTGAQELAAWIGSQTGYEPADRGTLKSSDLEPAWRGTLPPNS
ncbi:MAG: hypothetical protein RIC14_04785 [Filomicrobium sp.]